MLNERVQITVSKCLAKLPPEANRVEFIFNHWEDIARLDEVARDQVNPTARVDMLDAPLTVGGTRFYRLSPAAQETAFGELLDWFENDAPLCFAAVLYCMAHSRDRLALARLSSPARARKAIRSWYGLQRASHEALRVVLETLMPKPQAVRDEEESSPGAAADYLGRMVAILCREYGETPDFWLYECSTDRVDALLAEYAMRAEEELRTKAALAGVKAMNIDGPEARAAMRFLKACRTFMNKHGVPENEQ